MGGGISDGGRRWGELCAVQKGHLALRSHGMIPTAASVGELAQRLRLHRHALGRAMVQVVGGTPSASTKGIPPQGFVNVGRLGKKGGRSRVDSPAREGALRLHRVAGFVGAGVVARR